LNENNLYNNGFNFSYIIGNSIEFIWNGHGFNRQKTTKKMRNLITLVLIMTSALAFSQKEVLNVEKYKDCQVSIPIKGSGSSKEQDKKVVEDFTGIELIIIKTKSDGTIKNFYRGFIGLYDTDMGKSVLFETRESVNSTAKKQVVFLMYNLKNTYCYNAKCYDEKTGVKSE